MLGVLAVVLCRLLVTCAGVTVGVLDSGACATVIAVASFVSLRVSLSSRSARRLPRVRVSCRYRRSRLLLCRRPPPAPARLRPHRRASRL